MMLVPDGRILLSGGATVDDKCVPTYHKDLRQLDTETMLWSKARAAGGMYDEMMYAPVTTRENILHVNDR